jgi:hypothetical protein
MTKHRVQDTGYETTVGLTVAPEGADPEGRMSAARDDSREYCPDPARLRVPFPQTTPA